MGKYACGPPTYTDERNTLVCHPTTNPFKKVTPVVLFNRDSNGWLSKDVVYGSWRDKVDPGNRNWLKTMAEQCLIVIAPMTLQGYGNPLNPSYPGDQGTIDNRLCKK